MAAPVRNQKPHLCELRRFMGYARERRQRQLATAEPEETNGAAMAHAYRKFPTGEQAFRGEEHVAALMGRAPERFRAGFGKMPRAWRCLKGWRRLAPERSTKLAPLPERRAIAVEFARRDVLAINLGATIGARCHLSPSELLALEASSLIATASPAPQFRGPFFNLRADYEKSARLGNFWNNLPAAAQVHVRLCEGRPVEFLWSLELAPRPQRVPR
ncbi:unnamed protein product [Prorocentrum cordatum]|uniref:Uncharacterized protein n=1 Tax=Prorocentrum cordatum TaxID=2364126 RepID=A0ABN9X422_9DINO|nr:unnamed protein product [Polarella glacialis]